MRSIRLASLPSYTPRKGAALYVVVLAVTLIVAVLGLAALSELQLQRQAAQRSDDLQIARRYAQSAVEVGMQRIHDDADWRNTFSNGVWESLQSIGDGKYTLEGIDPDDGDLSDSYADSLVLTGIGIRGAATQKMQVTLVPEARGLTALEVAVQAGNDVTIHQPATVSGAAIIGANNNIVASGTVTIQPDCEAANSTSGTIQPGSTTTGVAPREMPTSDVFTYYQSNGTTISISSIPLVDSVRTIELVVISSANNPYGAGVTNAEGIYVVDCQSQGLRIRNCRIVGTLLLLNPASGSQIVDSVHWSASVANFPALLVDGTIALNQTNAALDETTTNFNPAGTPYEGNSDSDTDDSYASTIQGLVYISGDATSNNHPVLDGVVVIGNSFDVYGDLELSHQATYFDDPPPGFVDYSRLKVSSGTWRQSVD